ncbi:MAG: PEGA domain-containing protein [Chitinophagaceae bacterium]
MLQVPELTEPLSGSPATAQGPWRSGNTNVGGQNAYISQRVPTSISQRLNLQSGGQLVGGSTSIRVDLSQRTQVAQGSGPTSLLRRPLFLGLLVVGILSIAIAAIVRISRSGSEQWSVYIDSDPRGAQIRVNGQVQGNTPKRIVRSGQPEQLNIEIVKEGYRSLPGPARSPARPKPPHRSQAPRTPRPAVSGSYAVRTRCHAVTHPLSRRDAPAVTPDAPAVTP